MSKLAIKHFSDEDFRVLYRGHADYAIVVGWSPWAGLMHKIRDHHMALYGSEHDIKKSDYIFQHSRKHNGKVYWETYEGYAKTV